MLLRLRHISLVVVDVGLKGLGKVGGEGCPVVHLHIYIVPIARAPGGTVVSVPRALEVGGNCSLTGGSDKKISTVLVVESLKIGAAATSLVLCEQVVGGLGKVRLVVVKV